jgi:Ca2+-binding EF-hand superfamily protein
MKIGSTRWVLQTLGILKCASIIYLPLCLGLSTTARAFSDDETLQIFTMLDTNKDGHVSQVEYENNKIAVIFRKKQVIRDTTITFEETQLTREWFDAADSNHDGVLTGVETRDALRFESIDIDNKGFFTLEDLGHFLQKIER